MSVNPKEYNNMTMPDYDQLLRMIDRGIIKKIRKKPVHKPFKFGFRGGHYLGAPGKDIYFMLSTLSNDQFIHVAKHVALMFPTKPPHNHLHWAACIRYIYGCFEKQGCLRSKSDKKRMINENADWSLSIKFMEEVRINFKKNKNIYGRVLHHEMLGHRYGDRAVIEKNAAYLDTMIQHYEKSQRLGVKCKSLKHIFTPFYWAAHYYYEMGDKSNAAKYHMLSLKCMERICPDSRPGYQEKAIISIKQLRKCSSKEEWKPIRNWILGCKNTCLKKVKKAAK